MVLGVVRLADTSCTGREPRCDRKVVRGGRKSSPRLRSEPDSAVLQEKELSRSACRPSPSALVFLGQSRDAGVPTGSVLALGAAASPVREKAPAINHPCRRPMTATSAAVPIT